LNKKPKAILKELQQKFKLNFEECTKNVHQDQDLSIIFFNAKVISEIGQILKKQTHAKHQIKCCIIFDEIFSDIVSATFMASCSLDKPAHIILRRVIEIGIASIYLWDMPHIMYSWEFLSYDLSFSEMIKHLNSEGYKRYISEETGQTFNEIIESKILEKYYGEFSDILHGKPFSFESNLPNRFIFNKDDWASFTSSAKEILNVLISAYLKRFCVRNELIVKIPAFKNYRDI